ncbi:hypothetical protein ACIGB8_27545 [Promicromonospora sukumoe]|uniref:hypothetical protein n=1 Tax=Promicromonospora sukumoe TaxID=88382 RepID=UPI0037C81B19
MNALRVKEAAHSATPRYPLGSTSQVLRNMRVKSAMSSTMKLAIPQNVKTRGALKPQVSTTPEMGVVIDLFEADDRRMEAGAANYVSQVWADDWDCPEDSVYDSW